MLESWKINWDIESDWMYLFTPIENTQFLLTSWRMSGSEFIREVIRENFKSTYDIKKWGKSHAPLPSKYHGIFRRNNLKIIFAIADPRDVAAHIKFHENGAHLHRGDFTNPDDEILLLEENIMKINNLLNFYSKMFARNMIVLRYEDAVNNRNLFLNQVSKFINDRPSKKDSQDKYNSPIYKPIGVYREHFSDNAINYHTQSHINFYRNWGYE